MNLQSGVCLIYSDEDKINETGQPFMPYFKSDFDPLLLLGQNYVCHLTTVRRQLVADLGGLRSEFDGSQDWDLVLRVSEVVPREAIVHVPLVLYHWRSHEESTSRASAAKPWALEAGLRAVESALQRRGVEGEVGPGAHDLPELRDRRHRQWFGGSGYQEVLREDGREAHRPARRQPLQLLGAAQPGRSPVPG